MDFTPPFGQWLKQRRRDMGLRQEDLAQRAGYATITIRKIESGKTAPSREMAQQLAMCLGVPAADRPAFLRFARGLEVRERLNNLPRPGTSLVGREEDVAQVRELLRWAGGRLVTVMGAPGVGKTRLAIQVAREVEAAYADGVCFVALAPVAQGEQVAPAVAEALGLSKPGARTAAESVAHCLRGRRLLLVLDNCEQVLDGAGWFVAEMLEAAPDLTVLATSRAALRLTTERVYDLAPLALPDGRSAASASPAGLTACAAVELFVQRAGAAKQGFHLTEANGAAVADICRRLDGLPLAIELAAVRTRMFTPQTLLQRLNQHQGAPLRLLTRGAHDLPARQQTLRAAIDWSYHLLEAEQQALFRHLGVFVGGCTLEAVVDCEPAAEDGDVSSGVDRQSAIVDRLQSLIDQSLVQREEGPDGGARYTMLETIREYALEQLQASGEVEAARRRHLAYYTRLAESCVVLLEPDPSERELIRRMDADYSNLRAAALWSQTASVDPLVALRLAVAITPVWAARTDGIGSTRQVAELLTWVEQALSRCVNPPLRLRALAVHSAGWLRLLQSELTDALENTRAYLSLCREMADKRELAAALYAAGAIACLKGDYEPARLWTEEHLALSRELGLRSAAASGLELLGMLALERGEYARAASLMEEALGIARELGIQWSTWLTGSLNQTLKHLGVARLLAGDVRGGSALLKEALALARERGDWLDTSCLLVYLGHAAWIDGDASRARVLLRESLPTGRGKDYLVCVALAELAEIARDGGDDGAYAVLAGAAEGQAAVHPQDTLRVYNLCSTPERILSEAHARLGDPVLAAAFAEGRAMTWEQAMAYALADPGEDSARPARPAGTAGN